MQIIAVLIITWERAGLGVDSDLSAFVAGELKNEAAILKKVKKQKEQAGNSAPGQSQENWRCQGQPGLMKAWSVAGAFGPKRCLHFPGPTAWTARCFRIQMSRGLRLTGFTE